jgi:glycosyltransferase involved in cell wall biosynthesis
MLFVGALDYEPNADAVRSFVTTILPTIVANIPEARLDVIGRGVTPELRALASGVPCHFHGAVPDLAPFMASASIVVVPIRLGSGTRLKVIDALMAGKAMVATTIGTEGLHLRPDVDLLIADTPESFAAACIRLHRDPVTRARIGTEGRTRVLAQYDWDVIGVAVRALVASSIGYTSLPPHLVSDGAVGD